MAQTIQDLLVRELERTVTAAGLQLVTVKGIAGREGSLNGTWHIMDGLDTRLRVRYIFGPASVTVVLGGQALNAPDLEFFKARTLYPQGAGSHTGRTVKMFAEYADGDQLRWVLGIVADLLAPFAKAQDKPPGPLAEAAREAQALNEPIAVTQHPYQAAVLFAGDSRLTAIYYAGQAELDKGLGSLRNDLADGIIETALVTGPDNEVIFDSTKDGQS